MFGQSRQDQVEVKHNVSFGPEGEEVTFALPINVPSQINFNVGDHVFLESYKAHSAFSVVGFEASGAKQSFLIDPSRDFFRVSSINYHFNMKSEKWSKTIWFDLIRST
jgi:hypothetical protein